MFLHVEETSIGAKMTATLLSPFSIVIALQSFALIVPAQADPYKAPESQDAGAGRASKR